MSSNARASAATNGEEPPCNKKKKPSQATEPTLTSISSLPYDLLLICLARVSRLYYPILSLVSKNFQSVIASSDLYETRSRLNHTERCLYLCLNSSGKCLVEIPSPNYLLPADKSRLVAAGSNIYKIGGSHDAFELFKHEKPYSSSVSVLDCRSHTWHQAPSMSMKRNSSSTTSLVDEKIYVAGGCKDKYISYPNWIEVFDLKTQTWGNVTNPRIFKLRHGVIRKMGHVAESFELEGKLYMFGDENVVYNPKEDRWNVLGVDKDLSWAVRGYSYCVIDDVLLYWDTQVFNWYDCKVSSWKELNGLEEILPDFRGLAYFKMVDLGGKMALLWDNREYGGNDFIQIKIWCAEIALERRDGDEIWGKVEWIDLILTFTVPGECEDTSFDAISASV
ncbi:hypothetical protein AALP_AA5G266300 [Arabis alpina]|uniref:F-box domain-containing protein n=1 Tax=Arabis alpina TaxID=50452 RepID=A0A087GZJ5_ARAAL|nr:hypothetical protein AALP_AA5G266300 [Arabis alpina]